MRGIYGKFKIPLPQIAVNGVVRELVVDSVRPITNGGISVERLQDSIHSEREVRLNLPTLDLVPIIALAYLDPLVIIN